jgi:hypothetical protein
MQIQREVSNRTRLSIMKLSRLPIAPISLPSGPLYRPVTITLYNTCHHLYLKGILVTSQGPYSHTLQLITFTQCPPTCVPTWQFSLRWLSRPARTTRAFSSLTLESQAPPHPRLRFRPDHTSLWHALPPKVVLFLSRPVLFAGHLHASVTRLRGGRLSVSSWSNFAFFCEDPDLHRVFAC